MRNRRRKAALARLEAQLVSNTKNKRFKGEVVEMPLTKKDTDRIKREIAALKQRIIKER